MAVTRHIFCRSITGLTLKLSAAWLILLFFTVSTVNAAVLPEERVDALYHNYTGGGITVDGPSILVRKNFADTVSVSANYYVDNITSASIDAVTQASEYTEQRVQQSVGVDYLNDSSTITFSYTSSIESDYEAATTYFGISQEMFGGMTTVSLGFTQGDNIVMQTGKDDFRDFATFRNYRASLAQVLTKNLILSLTYDAITDEGFLNNPYRQVRYSDGSGGYLFQPERYPRTRTSNAASFNLRYFLPYRAAIYGGYRYFVDDWNIKSDTFETGYVHPLGDNWIIEASLRYYVQTQANFYNDLFPYFDAQNYLARDKELSDFSNYSFGLGLSYDFESDNLLIFERGSANLYFTYINFTYNNFRDIRVTGVNAGDEPLYSFSAVVTRLYFSFWF